MSYNPGNLASDFGQQRSIRNAFFQSGVEGGSRKSRLAVSCGTIKSPTRGKRISGLLHVRNRPPASVAKVGMRKFMSNHVQRKRLRTIIQILPQDNTTGDVLPRSGRRHEQTPRGKGRLRRLLARGLELGAVPAAAFRCYIQPALGAVNESLAEELWASVLRAFWNVFTVGRFE